MNRDTSAVQNLCSESEARGHPDASTEQRTLFIPTSAKDADVTQKLFAEEGLPIVVCRDLPQLCRELSRGAAAVMFSEEVLESDDVTPLLRYLREQPAWSDLPILLLVPGHVQHKNVSLALDNLGSVSIIQRPVRVATLLSTVRAAVRMRRKQYELRDLLLELQATQETLREHDRQKDRFLAVLGHEIRNPLSVLTNAVQFLQIVGIDEQHQQTLQIMQRQVKQLTRLSQDLSDISRIIEGKISLDNEPVSLVETLQNAWHTVRHLAEEKNHTAHFDMPRPENAVVRGDTQRLEQVFGNLLTNAIKYSEPESSIWIRIDTEEEEVCVRLRDSGIGIPPEKLPHIFDIFVQVEGHASHAQGGLGLGLALVKQLVTLHGGSVEVFSEGAGTGSEFRVRLPRANPSDGVQR